jgi:mannose-P-dolichol utilization defect protein 1
LQEVDDKLILYGFIAGFALNLVLGIQMVYYWNEPTKASTKGKQKEKFPAVPTTASSTAIPKSKTPTTRRRG